MAAQPVVEIFGCLLLTWPGSTHSYGPGGCHPPSLPLSNDSPAIEALLANGAPNFDAPNAAADQPQTQNSYSMPQTRPRRPLGTEYPNMYGPTLSRSFR